MDDKQKTGIADSELINAGESYELEYWAKKMGVSKEQIKTAIRAVGNSATEVKKYLWK